MWIPNVWKWNGNMMYKIFWFIWQNMLYIHCGSFDFTGDLSTGKQYKNINVFR